jgi:hypothetical protein
LQKKYFELTDTFVHISDITFESNDRLKQKLANKALPKIEYVNIPINDKESKYIITSPMNIPFSHDY